ncbi:MAG: hypothetical protein JO115_00295 [Pseudonocardiales bacterium]|nr:hypothetical protein [Pseudonocardiales bacterium]MBV9139363.1 hypothetical protein [Pseudonocardiales bacterium]
MLAEHRGAVWGRAGVCRQDEQVIIVHVGERGPLEVARHAVGTPGSPRLDDAHFPPVSPGALSGRPRPRGDAEAAFLSIGGAADRGRRSR